MFIVNITCMGAKQKISAVTRRWALPIAVILLPGGFVLLAFTWVYKAVASSGKRSVKRCIDTSVLPIEDGAFFSILRANSSYPPLDVSGSCLRAGAMRRQPSNLPSALADPSLEKAAA
jgi:hypothetical protein